MTWAEAMARAWYFARAGGRYRVEGFRMVDGRWRYYVRAVEP